LPSARKTIKNVLGRAGYRVVRVPVSGRLVPPAEGSPTAEAHRPTFFPNNADFTNFNPWPIPPDLAANTMPWAKVLLDLYQKPASWPACVSPETGLLIHALVRNLRPTTIIETGTCHGASTIWIAAALELSGTPGVIHTFDDFRIPDDPQLAARPLYKDRENLVRARFRNSGLAHRIVIHKGDSSTCVTEAAPALSAAGGVQLAFIDGDHSVEGVLRDWRAAEPLVNIGGYVLLHDMWPGICNWDGPRWLADHINEVSQGRYQICDIYTAPLNYGVCLLRRVT
jgi:predicted O-methyltransferase YrrM